MNVQEIFVKNKDQLLFSDDSKIIKLREDILKKFTKEYFNKKNNESIKLVDLSILDKLNYNFHNKKIFSSIKIKNNNFYELNIVNGLFQNFCNKKITINLVSNKDSNNVFNINSLPENDYIFDINSLLTNSGYELLIKKNQKVFLNVTNSFSKDDLTVFQKNLIKCEEGSEVTIIDNYINDLSSFYNIFTRIKLENNSKLQHIIIQNNSKFNNLFLTTQTDCYKNSQYNQTTFNFSDSFVRNHHYSNLHEPGSRVNHNGVFFLKDINQYLDIPEEALSEDFTGIRPKIQAPGEPAQDFIITNEKEQGYNNFINLIGIESPGLTSSLAIAEYVKDIID